jgi:hypothetical protein
MKAHLAILVAVLSPLLVGAAENHHRDWKWPKMIPAYAVISDAPATRRDSSAFDTLRITKHTSLEKIVRTVGIPDSFSSMLIYSFRQGVPPISSAKDVGTFCYFLKDGGAVYLQVASGHTIQMCIRYERDGTAHLLYK